MKDSSEPYDYKFVKWMIKNKVMFIGFCNIVLLCYSKFTKETCWHALKNVSCSFIPWYSTHSYLEDFIYLFYFLATLCCLQDLSSVTKDWTYALGSESRES